LSATFDAPIDARPQLRRTFFLDEFLAPSSRIIRNPETSEAEPEAFWSKVDPNAYQTEQCRLRAEV
jgi:hypothetical protein